MKVIKDERAERIITLELTESELMEITSAYGLSCTPDRQKEIAKLSASKHYRFVNDCELYTKLKEVLEG